MPNQVLLALRPAAALAAMAHALHEVELARRKSEAIKERVATGAPSLPEPCPNPTRTLPEPCPNPTLT